MKSILFRSKHWCFLVCPAVKYFHSKALCLLFLYFEIATLFLFDYSILNVFCWALFKNKKQRNFYLPLFTSAFSGVGTSPSAWCEAWKPAAARWCFWRTCWMKLEPGCCTTWASQKVQRSGDDKRARFLARTLLCETRAPVTWIFLQQRRTWKTRRPQRRRWQSVHWSSRWACVQLQSLLEASMCF